MSVIFRRLRAPQCLQLSARYLQTSSKSMRSDPYPLPLDPSLQASSSSSSSSASSDEQWPMPEPLERLNEDEKTIRARLVYQSRKRGMLEGDLLLSTFARDHLGTMSVEEMREFDKVRHTFSSYKSVKGEADSLFKLLDEPDWDIFYWSIEKRKPPPRWEDTTLLAKLREHARNEGKVVRKMPDLGATR